MTESAATWVEDSPWRALPPRAMLALLGTMATCLAAALPTPRAKAQPSPLPTLTDPTASGSRTTTRSSSGDELVLRSAEGVDMHAYLRRGSGDGDTESEAARRDDWYGARVIRPTEDGAADRRYDWPSNLYVRMAGAAKRARVGDRAMRNSEGLFVANAHEASLDELLLVGAEVALDVRVHGPLRLGGGVTFMAPTSTPDATLHLSTGRVSLRQINAAEWFAEMSGVFILRDLTLAIAMQAGYSRLVIDFGGARRFDIRGFTMGPRVALRTRIRRKVYAEAAARMNLLDAPDLVATLGIGIGHSRPTRLR